VRVNKKQQLELELTFLPEVSAFQDVTPVVEQDSNIKAASRKRPADLEEEAEPAPAKKQKKTPAVKKPKAAPVKKAKAKKEAAPVKVEKPKPPPKQKVDLYSVRMTGSP
jgi:hypothetical protein